MHSPMQEQPTTYFMLICVWLLSSASIDLATTCFFARSSCYGRIAASTFLVYSSFSIVPCTNCFQVIASGPATQIISLSMDLAPPLFVNSNGSISLQQSAVNTVGSLTTGSIARGFGRLPSDVDERHTCHVSMHMQTHKCSYLAASGSCAALDVYIHTPVLPGWHTVAAMTQHDNMRLLSSLLAPALLQPRYSSIEGCNTCCAGNVYIPGSNVSASTYRVVSSGAASDGSQDLLLGGLTGTLLGSSPLLQLVAAPSNGPAGGDYVSQYCCSGREQEQSIFLLIRFLPENLFLLLWTLPNLCYTNSAGSDSATKSSNTLIHHVQWLQPSLIISGL